MSIRTLVLAAALALLQVTALSQSRDTTTATRTAEQHREWVRARQETFRDENGNGVDDRLERQGITSSARRDRFVDADGDGICDGRTAGLGFTRKAMHGAQATATGKGSGPDNRHGQGGKK